MDTNKLLSKYSIRSTKARQEIAKAIISLRHKHFCAEEVIERLRKKEIKVSRASAYRLVKLFSKRGVLRPVDLNKRWQMYETSFDKNHHDHLYCLNCGKIIEFENRAIENLQTKVCKEKKFKPLKHSLKILGLCRECDNA
ncbi:MAG: transcriptional repressor [Candidatus Omnitrophica bacterium]|nr:transcriptional repressor [Candidatus Omnitrophota bacterium]MDD5429340.1 transcriptional repressor [Candidatus Omnitrophota bacterium]